MTLRRWTDIAAGIGSPPTDEERSEFERFAARQGGVKKAFAGLTRLRAELPLVVQAYSRGLARGASIRRQPQRSPRSRRSRASSRARSPGRSSDDDPHELGERLAALILEHGPLSACTLATWVRRRKLDVLVELHAGPFRQIGKGRSARWEIAPEEPIPAEVVRFRDGVWKARRAGALDACEALELLLDPPASVMARLVAAA